MTPSLLYIARSGLYLSLFYVFYLLVMRRTTFFRLNRVLLLAGSYLCLLLPLIRLRTVVAAIGVGPGLTMSGVEAEPLGQALGATFPRIDVFLAVYIAGAVVTLSLYMISVRKMLQIIRRSEPVEREGCALVLLEEEVPSFSWGRKVVISRKDLMENPAIFTHEQMHVRCRHSLDLILFLPLQLLFWWNPLVWVTREELRLLHEYEADEGVIQKGIDATQYQLLLVRKAVGEQRFSMASGFQHAKLKNRIAMMLKPTSSSWIRWSYLAMIPVLAAFMFACNPAKEMKEPVAEDAPDAVETRSSIDQAEQTEQAEKEGIPFQLVEQKPRFNGSDANEFSKWVNERLNYPDQAKKDGAQGRVVLQFTVDVDGAVRDVRVLRGVREDLDAEAVRVVSSSPRWSPGIQEGKAVPVTYSYPIVYTLR